MEKLVSMKQKRARKRRYLSEEEKERLVRSYEESGISQMAFCRREEIGFSSLRRWIGNNADKRTGKKKGEVRFVEVEVAEQESKQKRRYRRGGR